MQIESDVLPGAILEFLYTPGTPGSRLAPPDMEEVVDLTVLVDDVDITGFLSENAKERFEKEIVKHMRRQKPTYLYEHD